VREQIRQTQEWLDERVEHWQRAVERAARAVQQAEAALEECEASESSDRDGHYGWPGCRREMDALERAEDHLRVCRENLHTAQAWRSRVQQSVAAYDREARRLDQVAGSYTERARAELASLHDRYEAVRQSQVAAGVAGAIAGGVVAIGAALASRVSAAGGSKWLDRGVQEVPVDQIDVSDSTVSGTEDFHKVSHDEMVRGFGKLVGTVRPAVTGGADGDYFSKLDDAGGLDYENGYRRVYDAFYGDSSIRLEKIGSRYNVINGYHRLAVARELGVRTVPARVIEQAG